MKCGRSPLTRKPSCGRDLPEEAFHPDGHGGRRNLCMSCEINSRFNVKRAKGKEVKNLVTTHGGSSRSRQKVRRG